MIIIIQEDSPAINAGTTVSLDEDYDGESRPMGGGYDIGADEVSSAVSCLSASGVEVVPACKVISPDGFLVQPSHLLVKS